MKNKVNNKLVKAVKGSKGSKVTDKISTSDMISAIVERSTAPLKSEVTATTAPVSAPDYGALLSAGNPTVSAPTSAPVNNVLVWGKANLNSRRLRAGTPLKMYRIAYNQRKDVFSGGAKLYVQGGCEMVDPQNQRTRFEVCVEYPHVDLYVAKAQLVALRAQLALTSAPVPSTEVTKIA